MTEPTSLQINFHRGAPAVSVELLRSTEDGSTTSWAAILIGSLRIIVFDKGIDADVQTVRALRDACGQALAKHEAANG